MNVRIISGLHGDQKCVLGTRQQLKDLIEKDGRDLYLALDYESGQQQVIQYRKQEIPEGAITDVLAYPALAGG